MMKTLLYNTCELGCDPVSSRFASDDSLYSFPSGYCFLYALGYRRKLLSRREIMTGEFPTVSDMRARLLKHRPQVPSRCLDQYDSVINSNAYSYKMIEDKLFYVHPCCECEFNRYDHDLSRTYMSDLLLVNHGGIRHFYFNPAGNAVSGYEGLSIVEPIGADKKEAMQKLANIIGKYAALKNPKKKKKKNKKKTEIKVEVKAGGGKAKKKKGRTPAGEWLRKWGGLAGTFFGNKGLGEVVGAGISKIFGQGDYQIQQNSLMSGGPPAFSPLNAGIRITHREYIGDVLSSTGYNVTTFRLQPNVSTVFPWLSQLASSFEQYQFNGCVAFLNTTSGNAISSTNNALGVWGITTVYDPTRPPLSTKLQAEEYNGCTAAVPSCSVLHAIECKPRSGVLDRYYVDYTGTVSGEDLKFYDHGLMNVFTQGQQQAGVSLGELWISYDISFFNPRIQPTGEDNLADHYSVSGTGINASNPMGTISTSLLPTTGSGLRTNVTAPGIIPGQVSLNFPGGSSPGVYLLAYNYQGGLTIANYFFAIVSGSANITAYNLLKGSAASSLSAPVPNSVTISGFTIVGAFKKSDTAAGSVLLGNASTVMPLSHSATTVDFFVIPIGGLITKVDVLDDRVSEIVRRLFPNNLLQVGLPVIEEESEEEILIKTSK
jgi:hypothetical protein